MLTCNCCGKEGYVDGQALCGDCRHYGSEEDKKILQKCIKEVDILQQKLSTVEAELAGMKERASEDTITKLIQERVPIYLLLTPAQGRKDKKPHWSKELTSEIAKAISAIAKAISQEILGGE